MTMTKTPETTDQQGLANNAQFAAAPFALLTPIDGWARSATGEATGWVHITPAVADLLLGLNTDNRLIRPRYESRLGATMQAGRWLRSHQGVAIDRNGVLLDGQHRLGQIIATGKAQTMLVTIGLDPAVKAVTDTGLRRSAFDFMEGKHKVAKSAAARILIALDVCPSRITLLDLRSAMEMVDNYDVWDWAHDPDSPIDLLNEYATSASRASTAFQNGIGPGPLLAAGILYGPDVAEQWFAGLDRLHAATGLPIGDPLRALLLRGKKSSGRTLDLRQRSVGAFACLKVARARARGDEVRQLVLSADEEIRVRL